MQLNTCRCSFFINVDTKILSQMMAARIKNVLPYITYHNQTGFIKDCYIGETVWPIFDIMELKADENIPGLMIFIDFQKACNSLEWNFLLKCPQYFNFGPDFIQWVLTFYKNIQSCVINNGIISGPSCSKNG